MPLPPLTKTWTVQVAYLVPPHASASADVNEYANRKQLLWAVKEKIRLHWGWVVKGSVDAAGVGGMDAIDRWTTSADLKWGNAVNDPITGWIVLERVGAAGVGRDFELLLYLRNLSASGGGNADVLSAYLSYAGFTGGSSSARPTASDEEAILVDGAWNRVTNGDQWAYRLTSWAATDGSVGRLAVTYFDLPGLKAPVPALYVAGEAPRDPVTAWTHPFVFAWIPDQVTFAALWGPAGAPTTRAFDANAPEARWFSWYFATDTIPFTDTLSAEGAAGQRNFQQVSNSISLEGNLTSIAIVSETPGKMGRHGELHDLWFGRDAATRTGDTFPADDTATRVAIDDLVFPWDGSTPEFV